MGLFSRKKNDDDQPAAEVSAQPAEAADTAAAAEAPDHAEQETPETPAEPTPQVGISLSSFRGLGGDAGPRPPVTPQGDPRIPSPHDTLRPGTAPAQPAPRELPLAPAAPPEQLETVPGLRDNALLRDALAALPESATGVQMLGVVRQLLQGHVFLRVQGNAREQLAEGNGRLSFGIARDGDKTYMLVFSSGKALHDAVRADGDASTSAVGQPVSQILKHVIDQNFAGIIVDNNSAPARAVLPREVLERALSTIDPGLRLKSAVAAPRDADSPRKVAEVLAAGVPLWVAVGKAEGNDQVGIAEARLADGTRLLQVYSHPLEVAAQGRDERALPLSVGRVAQILREHEALGGLLIDPAGPLITLSRDELAPVLALPPEPVDGSAPAGATATAATTAAPDDAVPGPVDGAPDLDE